MKFGVIIVVLVFLSACGGGSPTQRPTLLATAPPRNFTLAQLSYRDSKLSDLLKAEAQKAAALGRKPFVEFGASWCPPCQAIQQNLDDPRMAEAFKNTYIIQMDLDEWQTHLSGTDFRVVAIPIYYEIDKNGRATGRSLSGAAWGPDTPDKMAPVLKNFLQKQ
jgi:thiol:disulfide interchange protein